MRDLPYIRTQAGSLMGIPVPGAHPNLPLRPASLPLQTGSRLLTGGWWGWSRHMNYFGDWLLALGMSLPTGACMPGGGGLPVAPAPPSSAAAPRLCHARDVLLPALLREEGGGAGGAR